MQRIKAIAAVILALVWVPAISCCLIDASGLLGKQDCCSKDHADPVPGTCDKPCGALASGSYLPQYSPLLLVAPVGLSFSASADFLADLEHSVRLSRAFPATAPPELAGHWQFSFRTACSPRAPSPAA